MGEGSAASEGGEEAAPLKSKHERTRVRARSVVDDGRWDRTLRLDASRYTVRSPNKRNFSDSENLSGDVEIAVLRFLIPR